jgi:hypothetical protein
MTIAVAGQTFFFHVRDFPIGGDLAITPRNAPTPERCESEQTNKTHHGSPPKAKVSNVCTAELPDAA